MSSDPYSIQTTKEEKKLQKERTEKLENNLAMILEELKKISIRLDKIEGKI